MAAPIDGTWPDKRTGLRHRVRGRLLGVSAPSRWDTRTACGRQVYVCPDTSDDDVVTCIACLGGAHAAFMGLLHGAYSIGYRTGTSVHDADIVETVLADDTVKFFDVSTVFEPAKPSESEG